MNEEFIKHKRDEAKGFLKAFWGKITHHEKERLEGLDQALDALEEEKKIYKRERKEAKTKISEEENPERDISAI